MPCPYQGRSPLQIWVFSEGAMNRAPTFCDLCGEIFSSFVRFVSFVMFRFLRWEIAADTGTENAQAGSK
jgi:hypothetical protein